MVVHGKRVTVATEGYSDIVDITPDVRGVVRSSGVREGIANIFAIGSTASVTTMEFEPALMEDMRDKLEEFAPSHEPTRHGTTWGDDNGFSHLRATFMGPGLTIPINDGEMVLGTWQQIVIVDHDNRPRDREVFVQVLGETGKPA